MEYFEHKIASLGTPEFDSPIKIATFIGDDDSVIYETDYKTVTRILSQNKSLPAFQKAGPRKKIFFNPHNVKAGIVTCGGLCPGLNDVIRSIVMALYYHYGTKQITGYRFGYNGLDTKPKIPPNILTPEVVKNIHNLGGSILGSSRGSPDVPVIVDTLERDKVNFLFCIGGDGTLKGAHEIALECLKRKNNIGIIGIPKTIDNDIAYISRTFGFLTAVEEGRRSITAIHNEVSSLYYGIGVVKLMGRDSGYIAANVCLADNDANYCLIPEVDFDLEGQKGLCACIKKRFSHAHHAVIVAAEGAGQKYFKGKDKVKDASGNILHNDIGKFIVNYIKEYFRKEGSSVTMKYIDPSYMVRSSAANAEDSVYCLILGQHAIHAAMAGKTDMVVSYWNNSFIHVPIKMATSQRKKIDPRGVFWESVLFATGQPPLKNAEP